MEEKQKEREFFDQVAGRWDEIRQTNQNKLKNMVHLSGVSRGEAVLDIGCGTGVLEPFLLEAVGDPGLVVANDFSAGMMAQAIAKYGHYPNVRFIAADVWRVELDQRFDKIICLNFFPHAGDKQQFISYVRKWLKPGGGLVIMHDISRQAVNSIHRDSGPAVENDRLPPAGEVAKWLVAAGYEVAVTVDNDEMYFIKACFTAK